MTTDRNEIPKDWDALVDRRAEAPPDRQASPTAESGAAEPPVITLMAASWADLVSMLAVCTAALVAVLLLGERPALPAFFWSAGLALGWWLFASSVLVVVRQGTPGMLLAGVSFERSVVPRRVAVVLAAALLGVATLGLSGLLGGRRSLLRVAAMSDLVMEEAD